MRVTVSTILIVMLILAGWAMAEADRPSIVCTNFPCYDFARHVAGEDADVTMLLKPGVEAHAYEPTPSDIVAIGSADLFVYIGGESDAWVESILSGFDGDDAPTALCMMDIIEQPIEEDEADDHHHSSEELEYDEHIWTSPRNAIAMVLALDEAIGDINPDIAAECSRRASEYVDDIRAIDTDIQDIVDHAVRHLIVFADRFPFIYLTREYGLDYMAAFPSCTADTEPSAQTVMSLIQRVMADQLPCIYTIEMSSQAIARTIAEETGAQVVMMQSMQTVPQDVFDAGATYVSIMRENAEALRKGLN